MAGDIERLRADVDAARGQVKQKHEALAACERASQEAGSAAQVAAERLANAETTYAETRTADDWQRVEKARTELDQANVVAALARRRVEHATNSAQNYQGALEAAIRAVEAVEARAELEALRPAAAEEVFLAEIESEVARIVSLEREVIDRIAKVGHVVYGKHRRLRDRVEELSRKCGEPVPAYPATLGLKSRWDFYVARAIYEARKHDNRGAYDKTVIALTPGSQGEVASETALILRAAGVPIVPNVVVETQWTPTPIEAGRIPADLVPKLAAAGYTTLEQIRALELDDLLVEGFSMGEAQKALEAVGGVK
jgi:hypothetical protein